MQGMIFNALGVEHILAGLKTHTRRPMKVQPKEHGDGWLFVQSEDDGLWYWWNRNDGWDVFDKHKPRFRLGPCYVKETHYIIPTRPTEIVIYRQGFSGCEPRRWRPSIYMPEWASRATLDIIRIWPERIQDISEEELRREGLNIEVLGGGHWAREEFQRAWDVAYDSHPENAWERNPWIWAYEFTVKEQP